MDAFLRVWNSVRETYLSGYMVYERGLQAALYYELRREFPERKVVVEPRWGEEPNVKRPDLVLVSRNEISDIYELKFKPHWPVPMEGKEGIQLDIKKLLDYEAKQHVTLDPLTGQWDKDEGLFIRDDCRRHIVVVTRANSPAVQPENIPGQLILWYGRIGPYLDPIGVDPDPNCWGICQGEQID